MPRGDEDWFTQHEQAHAAVLFVVLFAVVVTARSLLAMPVWLLLALGPLTVVVPFAVASWERHRRRSTGR